MDAQELLSAAVLGAFATGAVQIYLRARELRLRRRGAARLVMGDLYQWQEIVALILEKHRWTDYDPGLQLTLDRWNTWCADLAQQPSVLEWGKVDRVYRLLHRLDGRVHLGEPTTDADDAVLQEFVEKLPSATLVLAKEGSTRRERLWMLLKARVAKRRSQAQ